MLAEKIQVLVVDDSIDLATAIELTIDSEDDMCSVGTLHSADSLATEIADKSPNVVILDMTMPGKAPLDALREAAATYPQTKIIAYSGYDDAESVQRALDAGAAAYVSKNEDTEQLLDCLRRAAHSKSV